MQEIEYYARTLYTRDDDQRKLKALAIHTQCGKLVTIYMGEAQAKLVEQETIEAPCA